MKRNWEIIRKVLIALEEKPNMEPLSEGSFPEFPAQDVAYNMGLMIESGLATGQQMSTCGMGYIAPPTVLIRLTSHGHEFLDSIRGDSVWNHVKTKAVEKGIDLTFDVVATLAKGYISSLLGPH